MHQLLTRSNLAALPWCTVDIFEFTDMFLYLTHVDLLFLSVTFTWFYSSRMFLETKISLEDQTCFTLTKRTENAEGAFILILLRRLRVTV